MPARLLPLLALAACAQAPGDDPVDDLPAAPWDDGVFRVALLADPHVIGDDYVCCESSSLDTESIYRTRRRLEVTRELVDAVEPRPDVGFVLGDVFHQNYKHDRLEDYADPAKGSAAYHAKRILDGFQVPMHLLWGNHDYGVPEYSRDFAHELFRELFDTPPYHAVDLGGWRFLATNSQLGRTWDSDPMNAFFDHGVGSFGREQLLWMAEQLDEGQPTVLMFHHHPIVLKHAEDPDGPFPDVFTLIEAYRDRIAGIFVGHLHRWMDVSGLFDLPAWVVGSVRYDADNFWILDLHEDGTFTVLDADKAQLGSVYGLPATYGEDGVWVDLAADPEDDPAGPWDGWETPPDPWPPVE